MSEYIQKPKCECELSKQFKVTKWGDIVPADISDEELEKLKAAREKA